MITKILQSTNPYVIAEIGINHNGDISLAKEMIDAAKESGADCVKLQSFSVDKYISPIAGKADYQKQGQFSDKSQKEIIKSCEITLEQTSDLFDYSKKEKIDFLSTPFEVWSLRELISLNMSAIKVSSCNLTNTPFLEELADSKLPVLLSSGMASFNEVIEAVKIFQRSKSPLLLFQCTSNYPSKPENANLRCSIHIKEFLMFPLVFRIIPQQTQPPLRLLLLEQSQLKNILPYQESCQE